MSLHELVKTLMLVSEEEEEQQQQQVQRVGLLLPLSVQSQDSVDQRKAAAAWPQRQRHHHILLLLLLSHPAAHLRPLDAPLQRARGD